MRITPKKELTIELTPEIAAIIAKDNWSATEAELVLSKLKSQIEPQPEDIGRGLKFIGLSQSGTYTYSKTIKGKEKIYHVDPVVWEDTKHIFNDALRREENPSYALARLNRKMSIGIT